MHSAIVSLVILVVSSKAIEPHFLNMAGRSMDPMSRNFINSPLGAEMLDVEVGPGEQNFRERPYTGSGRQFGGYNRRYDPQPRPLQRDWQSQYPSEMEMSLPEKPLSNFDANQMTPTFGNSFRPPQFDNNKGLDNSFRAQQPAPNTNQFGSTVDDFFKTEQPALGVATSQVTPGFGDLFRPQQPALGIGTNQAVPTFGDLFRTQQTPLGIGTNPGTSGLSDFFRTQQTPLGIGTNPGTPGLSDFFRTQQTPLSIDTNPGMPGLSDFFRTQQSPLGIDTNPGMPGLNDLFRTLQSPLSIATNPVMPSLRDFFRPQQPAPNTNNAAPILTNAIRSLLASPNSDVNQILSLLGAHLTKTSFARKFREPDLGTRANLLNSPQAIPRPSPSGGMWRSGFLGRILTLGALDLIDSP